MYSNKQHSNNTDQHMHTNKQSKHNNTWFSTPKKARIPGHANHVLKTPLYGLHALSESTLPAAPIVLPSVLPYTPEEY